MSLTTHQIAEALGCTKAEAASALEGIDQARIRADVRANLVPGVWDKQSPINHCSAEDALASMPFVPDAVYTITDAQSDRVLIFQPHSPGVAGLLPMTEAIALACACAHADELATSLADAQVLELVKARLAPPVDPEPVTEPTP